MKKTQESKLAFFSATNKKQSSIISDKATSAQNKKLLTQSIKKEPLLSNKSILQDKFKEICETKNNEIKKIAPEVRNLHRKLNIKLYANFGPIYLNIKKNMIQMQCMCAAFSRVIKLKDKFKSLFPGMKYTFFNVPPHGHLLTIKTDLANLNVLFDLLNAWPDRSNQGFDDRFLDKHMEFRSIPLIPLIPTKSVSSNKHLPRLK